MVLFIYPEATGKVAIDQERAREILRQNGVAFTERLVGDSSMLLSSGDVPTLEFDHPEYLGGFAYGTEGIKKHLAKHQTAVSK